MFIIAWIIFFGLLVGLFHNWEQRQLNPNQNLMGYSSGEQNKVILEQNRQNHYVFTGKINGMAVDFLLDTGATHVSIPEHIAERLNLTKGYAGQASTANGLITVYATRIDVLEIGPIRLENVRATINPSMHEPQILLGMSALRNLTMIQENNQLILRQ